MGDLIEDRRPMKTIRSEDLPEGLSAREFLEGLKVSEDVRFESHGELRAVLISPQTFDGRRRARSRLFELIQSIRGQHAELDSDTLLVELESSDDAACLNPETSERKAS
jgi:hypothetical protein